MTADVALHTSPFDNLPHKMSQIKESKERDRDDDDNDMRLNKLSKNIIDFLLHDTVQIFPFPVYPLLVYCAQFAKPLKFVKSQSGTFKYAPIFSSK